MKKLLFLFLILLSVTSCKSTYYEIGYSLDYREYVKDPNFVINPTEIGNKDFTPVGPIYLEFHSGNKVKKEDRNYVHEKRSISIGKYYVPTYERMISSAVNKAKEMGANGIISFSIEKIEKVRSNLPVYIISGNAVIY